MYTNYGPELLISTHLFFSNSVLFAAKDILVSLSGGTVHDIDLEQISKNIW